MTGDSSNKGKSPPPEWGKDELSSFLDKAQFNQWATFANKKSEYAILREIDDCFQKIATNLIKPQNRLAADFLFRAHSAYRAAAGLVLVTQIPESIPVIRVCIEWAAYALHIFENPDAGKIWLERQKDESLKSKCRNKFTKGKINKTLKVYDKRLAEVYVYIYDLSIDFGAHPNELAVSSNMTIENIPEGKRIKHKYFQEDGPSLDHGLRLLAQSGLCSLFIFQHIFKARFELLGLRPRLQNLRKYL